MCGCWRDTVSLDCHRDVEAARFHGSSGGPNHLNGSFILSLGGLLFLCVISWNMIPRAILALSAFLGFSVRYFQLAFAFTSLTVPGLGEFDMTSFKQKGIIYKASWRPGGLSYTG